MGSGSKPPPPECHRKFNVLTDKSEYSYHILKESIASSIGKINFFLRIQSKFFKDLSNSFNVLPLSKRYQRLLVYLIEICSQVLTLMKPTMDNHKPLYEKVSGIEKTEKMKIKRVLHLSSISSKKSLSQVN